MCWGLARRIFSFENLASLAARAQGSLAESLWALSFARGACICSFFAKGFPQLKVPRKGWESMAGLLGLVFGVMCSDWLLGS